MRKSILILVFAVLVLGLLAVSNTVFNSSPQDLQESGQFTELIERETIPGKATVASSTSRETGSARFDDPQPQSSRTEYTDWLAAHSVPAERSWLTAEARVDLGAVESLLAGEGFESALAELERDSSENVDAYEFTEIYGEFLETTMSSIDSIALNAFACGLRTCMGEVSLLNDEARWMSFSRRFSNSDNTPPIYVEIPHRITDPDDPGSPARVRFIISIDPDSGSVRIPSRFSP